MTAVVTAGRVLGPAGLLEPGWVEVAEDRLVGVGAGEPARPADAAFPDGTLTPGFVDAHVHGGGGRSFTEGTVEAAEQVVAAHLAEGTTTMVASLVTESLDVLERAVHELSGAVREGLLAGLHLEGPWLSRSYAGAHNPALLQAPDLPSVRRVLSAGDGSVRTVTLAPELPGALDAIELLAAEGVTVAVGHTDATYEVTRDALAAGATAGTHLFNAMRGVHHREPGPALALLEHPGTYVELIADGVHLHPAVLRAAAGSKPGRFVLVTDAMAAAASADGAYRLGPLEVVVSGGVATLAGSDTIAGSTLTMAKAVRYCATVAGMPLPAVLRAATATPAMLLGRDDVGVLRPGCRADLVVLDAQLDVARVMRAGRWQPPADRLGPVPVEGER